MFPPAANSIGHIRVTDMRVGLLGRRKHSITLIDKIAYMKLILQFIAFVLLIALGLTLIEFAPVNIWIEYFMDICGAILLVTLGEYKCQLFKD